MSRPSSRQSQSAHSTRQTATTSGRTSRIGIGRASSISSAASASDSAHQNGVEIGELTAAQQRLKDKQEEQAGFINILRQTQQLDTYLNEMAEKMTLLQDGGIAMAKVLENWQNVFRATHIAMAGMAARQARGEQDAQLPTLVRIPTAATAAAAASNANKASDDPSHNE